MSNREELIINSFSFDVAPDNYRAHSWLLAKACARSLACNLIVYTFSELLRYKRTISGAGQRNEYNEGSGALLGDDVSSLHEDDVFGVYYEVRHGFRAGNDFGCFEVSFCLLEAFKRTLNKEKRAGTQGVSHNSQDMIKI